MNTSAEQHRTVIVRTYEEAAFDEKVIYGYKGLRIHALPGLHEYVFSFLKKCVPSGSKVLDLAAGSGAMSLRLMDEGYTPFAMDYVSENFKLHDSVAFIRADLNRDFPSEMGGTFDAITATEIIEHLENPRHFARQCFKILKPGGTLIISTPNVDSIASIVSMIRRQRFQWFDDQDYLRDGHITPLTQWQIETACKEAGFELVLRSSYGDPIGWCAGSPRLKILSFLVSKVSKVPSSLNSQIFVVVLSKPISC